MSILLDYNLFLYSTLATMIILFLTSKMEIGASLI